MYLIKESKDKVAVSAMQMFGEYCNDLATKGWLATDLQILFAAADNSCTDLINSTPFESMYFSAYGTSDNSANLVLDYRLRYSSEPRRLIWNVKFPRKETPKMQYNKGVSADEPEQTDQTDKLLPLIADCLCQTDPFIFAHKKHLLIAQLLCTCPYKNEDVGEVRELKSGPFTIRIKKLRGDIAILEITQRF